MKTVCQFRELSLLVHVEFLVYHFREVHVHPCWQQRTLLDIDSVHFVCSFSAICIGLGKGREVK